LLFVIGDLRFVILKTSVIDGDGMEVGNDIFDVLVVGGGPAGIAAASYAGRGGRHVAIVDDNPALGGQIWRGEQAKPGAREAAWIRKTRKPVISSICGARVFDQPQAGLLLAETGEGARELRYRKLILATGARERFLPFPGWTLPNVCGAGGLQALVKSGLPLGGKRVVIAGSGPLLLAAGAFLRSCGANIRLIAEQASMGSLLRFALGLFGHPGKMLQALVLKKHVAGIPYLSGCWPIAARGTDKLSSVTLRRGRRTWEVECDYLACGFHLIPNLELPELLGCKTREGAVRVSEFQETSVQDIYCAGETTGIGGLELALVEGRIAGYASAGLHDRARPWFGARERLRRFARVLNRSFALRDELMRLPEPETLVCRCEDVTFKRLQAYDSWRAAKIQTRCGMGPCQGRICGPAAEFLLGWRTESVRPPIFPTLLENLRAGTRSD
jgi:NADPH-dependent 2,4-dienoyl-CoA reductase/sulfur reductase-like enzyme